MMGLLVGMITGAAIGLLFGFISTTLRGSQLISGVESIFSRSDSWPSC